MCGTAAMFWETPWSQKFLESCVRGPQGQTNTCRSWECSKDMSALSSARNHVLQKFWCICTSIRASRLQMHMGNINRRSCSVFQNPVRYARKGTDVACVFLPCLVSTWLLLSDMDDRRLLFHWTLQCSHLIAEPGSAIWNQHVFLVLWATLISLTWTLFEYSSMKLPIANRNLQSTGIRWLQILSTGEAAGKH
jgi:hypothetical protein